MCVVMIPCQIDFLYHQHGEWLDLRTLFILAQDCTTRDTSPTLTMIVVALVTLVLPKFHMRAGRCCRIITIVVVVIVMIHAITTRGQYMIQPEEHLSFVGIISVEIDNHGDHYHFGWQGGWSPRLRILVVVVVVCQYNRGRDRRRHVP